MQFLALDLPPFGRGKRGGPIERAQFFTGVPGQLLKRPVDEAELAIGIAHAEGLEGAFEDASQKLVLVPGLAQVLFRAVRRGLSAGAEAAFGQGAHETLDAHNDLRPMADHRPRGGKSEIRTAH